MDAPIALFDSGLGGLTVLKSLALELPHENFIYIGDTARLPYGNKSPQTIRRYSEEILSYFKRHYAPKAVVIACNSASSHWPEPLWQGLHVFNVIDPGAEAALAATQNGRIGVLGTRATIESGVYRDRILQRANARGRSIEYFGQACPLLVPLAEEGWIDDPITNLVTHRYVQPLVQQNIDTLVLGCTHYPILINAIRRTTGLNIHLVEAGHTLAQALIAAPEVPMRPTTGESGYVKVMLTDTSERSKILSYELLKPIELDEYSLVNLGA